MEKSLKIAYAFNLILISLLWICSHYKDTTTANIILATYSILFMLATVFKINSDIPVSRPNMLIRFIFLSLLFCIVVAYEYTWFAYAITFITFLSKVLEINVNVNKNEN